MVMEAMTLKVHKIEQDAREAAERKQRLKSHRKLRGLKAGDPLPEGF